MVNFKGCLNKTALTEVLKNNGYKCDTTCLSNGVLNIEDTLSRDAFVDVDDNIATIKLFEANLDIDDAKRILKELSDSIDILEHIEFINK